MTTVNHGVEIGLAALTRRVLRLTGIFTDSPYVLMVTPFLVGRNLLNVHERGA